MAERISKHLRLLKHDTKLPAGFSKEYIEKIESAKMCAKILYRAGARQVWLFGSLAKGIKVSQLSDIDLAVVGMSRERAFTLKKKLRLETGEKVDLVVLETANPGFRNSIIQNRVLLAR